MDMGESIAEQWRKLGFWYDHTEEAGWELRGSKEGLLRFVSALRRYATHPANASPGEHQHFGPYSYLEVCTSAMPDINSHCIEGPPAAVARLADLLEARLATAEAGDRFDLAPEYAPGGSCPCLIRVEVPEFDPASLDPHRGQWPPPGSDEAPPKRP